MKSEDDRFKNLFYSMPKYKVPDKLAYKTLELIKNDEVLKKSDAIFETLTKKIYRLRFAFIAVLLALIITLPLLFIALNTKNITGNKSAYIVKFIYKDKNAKSVFIVGDFNCWDKNGIIMKKVEGTDLWVADIILKEGTYKYNFLVNGDQWSIDPFSKIKIKDKFGNESSVLVLLPINNNKRKIL